MTTQRDGWGIIWNVWLLKIITLLQPNTRNKEQFRFTVKERKKTVYTQSEPLNDQWVCWCVYVCVCVLPYRGMSPDSGDAVPSDGRRQGASSMQVLYWATPGLGLIHPRLWVVLRTVAIKTVRHGDTMHVNIVLRWAPKINVTGLYYIITLQKKLVFIQCVYKNGFNLYSELMTTVRYGHFF